LSPRLSPSSAGSDGRARPRVLIYRDFLLPASETFIKNQAEGLRRFEAHYAGLSVVEGLTLPADRVISIYRSGNLGRVENAAFNRLGISPRILWRLWRLRAQLAHAHFGFDGTRILRLVRALKLPLVVTFHDYDVTTSDEDLLKLGGYATKYIQRRPALNEQASAFLAVSRFIKQQAIARGFSAEKILVHYIGIDVSAFRPDPQAQREPVVLFVGRLVAKKGGADLIRAMADVQASRPDVELVMVGDGPLRHELEQQARASLKRFRFVGHQTPAQVRAWHARAQVFCAPSVTAPSGETEGLPISILEAQAAGLPVVSTSHAGIPEAVIDGETGFLAPEHDSALLGQRLLAMVSNPDLAGRLSAAARDQVLSRFNLERQNALLEDIYSSVVARPRGPLNPAHGA